MSSTAEKILVVGPSWIGDMVMSHSLYSSLLQQSPETLIDVLAPSWSAALLARMPEVRNAIVMPVGHGELGLQRRWRLARTLREEQYDQAIVLPNSLKSALVPLFAGIPVRTGWRGEWRYGLLNDMRRLDTQALPLMVQRFFALSVAPGELLPTSMPPPRLQVDQHVARQHAANRGLSCDLQTLALCPGAEFGGAKRWPTEYFAELAEHYLARGWQVALYGSEKDVEVCEAISRGSGEHNRCHNLAGRTSLAEVIDLLSTADVVISNDSGLMHIAAAVQLPLVAIYGPTSPGFTPPLHESAVLLRPNIDCAPCFARECPLQHHRCMRDTTPSMLIAEIEDLLASDGGVQ